MPPKHAVKKRLGTLRCDRLDLNQATKVTPVVAALAAEMANSTCWTELVVRDRYYFATPRRPLPSWPGRYVTCDEHSGLIYGAEAVYRPHRDLDVDQDFSAVGLGPERTRFVLGLAPIFKE